MATVTREQKATEAWTKAMASAEDYAVDPYQHIARLVEAGEQMAALLAPKDSDALASPPAAEDDRPDGWNVEAALLAADEDAAELRRELAELKAAQAPPAATLKSLEIGVCSSNCGPVYRADEDGCCVTCGGDITFHDRSWPLGQTRCTVCRDTALPCQLGHTGRMLGSRSVAPVPPASDPPGLDEVTRQRDYAWRQLAKIVSQSDPPGLEAAIERTREYIRKAMGFGGVKQAICATAWDRAHRSGLEHALNALNAEVEKATALAARQSSPPSHWDALAAVVYELLDADDRTDLLHGTGFATKLRAALVAPHKPYPLPASPQAKEEK